jgi:hypothetical protein
MKNTIPKKPSEIIALADNAPECDDDHTETDKEYEKSSI